MKTLLLLNGTKGSQLGIEDGFDYLYRQNKIASLKYIYYLDYNKANGSKKTCDKILHESNSFQPDLIIFFHIGNFPIQLEFLQKLKSLNSRPIIVYDEGDMYGGLAKPITGSMKKIIKFADVVSIRGLGSWYNKLLSYNKNVIYTPHSNSLFRYTNSIESNNERQMHIIFIGTRVTSKWGGRIRRQYGAHGREKLAKFFGRYFPQDFHLYGDNWDGFIGSKGILEFNRQAELFSNSWFHLSYEHYPKIPYYFSDRLPISLASGQIYVCHYHAGYEQMFKHTDFIYFFNNKREAVDILNYLKSLSRNQLLEKSKRAKEWADKHLSPEVVWTNFFNNVIKIAQNQRVEK